MYKSSLVSHCACYCPRRKNVQWRGIVEMCLAGGNRITVLIFSDKPTENITVKYLTKDTVQFISASRPSTENFIRRVPLFVAVSVAPASCNPPNGNVNFVWRPLQTIHAKNSGMLQILCILPLIAASVVAWNEHRRFLYSFKTKCVDMAVIHVLYAIKLKLWLKSNSV